MSKSKSDKPKRINIVPGTKLLALPGLSLDPHLLLFNKTKIVGVEMQIDVLTKPRRDKDGINLVKVRLPGGVEYDVFYCDILKYTKLI